MKRIIFLGLIFWGLNGIAQDAFTFEEPFFYDKTENIADIAGKSSFKIQKGDLSFLKNEQKLNCIFDYSSADIKGMKESEIIQYEKDWIKDRPRYQGRFFHAIEKRLQNKYFFVGNYPDAQYTLTIKVEHIEQKGTIYAQFIFHPTNSTENVCVCFAIGDGGTLGTFLNLVGDGHGSLGDVFGKQLCKIIKK